MNKLWRKIRLTWIRAFLMYLIGAVVAIAMKGEVDFFSFFYGFLSLAIPYSAVPILNAVMDREYDQKYKEEGPQIEEQQIVPSLVFFFLLIALVSLFPLKNGWIIFLLFALNFVHSVLRWKENLVFAFLNVWFLQVLKILYGYLFMGGEIYEFPLPVAFAPFLYSYAYIMTPTKYERHKKESLYLFFYKNKVFVTALMFAFVVFLSVFEKLIFFLFIMVASGLFVVLFMYLLYFRLHVDEERFTLFVTLAASFLLFSAAIFYIYIGSPQHDAKIKDNLVSNFKR